MYFIPIILDTFIKYKHNRNINNNNKIIDINYFIL